MLACAYGAAFGAIQQMPRIVPGPAGGRGAARRPRQQQTVSGVQSYQEIGGLAGRILLAFLAVRIVVRRALLRLFQVPGLIVVPLVFCLRRRSTSLSWRSGASSSPASSPSRSSASGATTCRACIPTYLRGTGESFAANVGGRMIGTCAALVTTQLATSMPGATPARKLAYAAALVGLAGRTSAACIASFWLPEPKQEELPE